MAITDLAYPDLALDKFSGTDPDQDAESIVQLIERKIYFALGDAPADPDDLVSYTFSKKALFSSLLREPAAEWYENNVENATTWPDTREQFITRFSDGRNKFRHRMEVEHCVRGDGEEIRNFLHRIMKIVDKGWPDDMEGIVEAEEIKKVQDGMMAGKRVTFTNDYNKRRGPSHGSGQFTYNNDGNRNPAGRDITDTQQSTYDGAPQFHPRSNWGNPTKNNTFNSGRGRPFNRYQNQFTRRNDDNDYRTGNTGAPSGGTWPNIGTNPRSPSGPRQDPPQNRQYQPSRSSTPDNSVFRQSNSQESGGFVPYEQRSLPTNQ